MISLSEGVYQIYFTSEQMLTGLGRQPGAPLVLLPPGNDFIQEWQVRKMRDGYTISARDTDLAVSYDGEPDLHEMAILLPDNRVWQLLPGIDTDTYVIAVPNAPMRLGMSPLRIFPPRVALAPDYGPQYQAWMFKHIG